MFLPGVKRQVELITIADIIREKITTLKLTLTANFQISCFNKTAHAKDFELFERVSCYIFKNFLNSNKLFITCQVPTKYLLLGASVRNSARDKGHEEGGSAYTKAGLSLRSPPGNSRASTPKNHSLPTFCFVLSPTPLTLWGAVPHHLSLKKELTYSSS